MFSILRKKYQQHAISLLLIFQLINQIKTYKIIYNDPSPVPTLIRQHGYRTETHEVITEDGYILNLHRIPNPGRPPILVNHGILGSSAIFVVRGPDRSLAYVLHRAGFDVWLGNYRGNAYSKKHVFFNSTQFEFWQFGVHEMGVYDLAAEIDYIRYKTNNRKINYVGFSLATMYYWILMSERPEYNNKINQMHALAPMAYWGNEGDINNFMKKVILLSMNAYNNLGIGEVLPITILNTKLSILCRLPFLSAICSFKFLTIFARETNHISPNLVPLLIKDYPAGLSVKTIQHSVQLIGTGRFSKYDYGSIALNLKYYNRISPPEYDLSKVTSPVFIQYGLNDIVALPRNVEKLCARLANCKERRLIPDPTFGHEDFTWGTSATNIVYNYMIRILYLPIYYYTSITYY